VHQVDNKKDYHAIKMSKESEFKAGQMLQKSVMKGRGCKKDTH